jgi:hypothetical protein
VVALVVPQYIASSGEGTLIVRSDSSAMDMPLGHSEVEEMHRTELNGMASYGAHRGH